MSGKQAVLAVLHGEYSSWQHRRCPGRKERVDRHVGRIFISDQGIHGSNAPTINPFVRSGKGLTFEVDYARHLQVLRFMPLSLEVPAVFNLDEDLGSGGDVVPTGYQQIFVTPAIRVNLFPRNQGFALGEFRRRVRPLQREQQS